MRKLLLLAVCLFGVLVGGQSAVHADVNDFVVNNFSSKMTLTKADEQGQLHIVENIKLTFNDKNHGILRALPERYNKHDLNLKINKVSSPSGASASYTTYKSNGNLVLKIGSSSDTVTGSQEYVIDYTVQNVIAFKNGEQKLIWNVNGAGWSQVFDSVSVEFENKSGSKLLDEPVCYTGTNKSKQQNCIVTKSERGLNIETTRQLGRGENLTYQTAFKQNSFQPFGLKDKVLEVLPKILSFSLPIVIVGGYSYSLWNKKGRDAKGRGVIIPEYGPPKDLKPLVAGTLIDFRTETKDITATIIDLAIKGYIKILESKEVKSLAPDKLVYSLELLRDDLSDLDAQELKLIDSIFSSKNIGETVDISSLSSKLYTTSTQLGKDAKMYLEKEGYYRPKLGVGFIFKVIILWIAGLLAFFVAVGFQNGWLIAGLIIGAVISIICIALMSSRTAKGVQAKEHMFGLKMYLEVAEKDRINKLQTPNAPYASNKSEPVRTIDLFEKLLPYAIVLGVEGQWAKQFESMYTSPPNWYGGGNWASFNSAVLVSSINSGVGSAVNQAFSAPSSSGSSGGFSGGGGGGGGGGGW